MSLNNKTYYALLGVSMDADTATIDQAYRHLQKEYASLGDGRELQARLQLLSEAHACLSNPLRRRIYDNSLADRPAATPIETAPAKTLPLKPIGLVLLGVLLVAAGLAFKSRQPTAAVAPDAATDTAAVTQATTGDGHAQTSNLGPELQTVFKQLMDIDLQISELQRQAAAIGSQYNEQHRSIDIQYGHHVENGGPMTEHSRDDTPSYSEERIKQAVAARHHVEQLHERIEELEQRRIQIDEKRQQLVAAKQRGS